MKTLRILLSFVSLGIAAAPARAQVVYPRDTTAYTTAQVKVRERPVLTAIVVTELPAGSPLIMRACVSGWCSVKVSGDSGYALQEYLTLSAPAATSTPARSYINSRGERVQSPTKTADGRPPAGASAQCRDGTYSFSRSRSGTCSHHGGVARWLE